MVLGNLFDNRYQYDHIYPRGRSGEALRAIDTQNDNRPVVIKRPAPQDAPPIRAGQEMNIRTERRALIQLKDHPALTNLLDEGTFSAGGQSHLYIVMERAGGDVIEDEVFTLAKDEARLPELEMLGIMDKLLDLLAAAHELEIVYNDVDAKHLFWDRDTYQLKVIDWGNAVFLEGDEVTGQGISRQNDIFQVGELLYFMVTGGQRLAANGTDVDFGPDPGRITTRLQGIVKRAVHPKLELRYQSIVELREDLAQYRNPIERDRDRALSHIESRLERNCSQRELESLSVDLQSIRLRDPGFPLIKIIQKKIDDELHRLGVLADLDAVRIYLDSENWQRARTLLTELVGRSSGAEKTRSQLLLSAATLLDDAGMASAPAAIPPTIEAIYADSYAEAAHVLLVTPDAHPDGKTLQWLLAERIQEYVPEVLVLRPHLLRLEQGLAQFEAQEALRPFDDARAALAKSSQGSVANVINSYQLMVDHLAKFTNTLASAVIEDGIIADMRVNTTRAQDAAAAIVAHLKEAVAQASADPASAQSELGAAFGLDPVNNIFQALQAIFAEVQESLSVIEHYQPKPDGTDIEAWLRESEQSIQQYSELIPDPRLVMLTRGLSNTQHAWSQFSEAAVQGNRAQALEALQHAADAIRHLNPELSVWFANVLSVVEKARYIQRHALNNTFGRAMADGWSAWDRGSGIEAERLGKAALEVVATDSEEFVADRLIRLGKYLRNWKEGNGEGDPALTRRMHDAVLTLFTEEEEATLEAFETRQASEALYLSGMQAGLVSHFESTSTTAQRILFFRYVLRGVREMYDGLPDDALFWRDAALKTLPDAERHTAYLALTNVIRDRRGIVGLVDRVDKVHALSQVADTRRELERSSMHLLLRPLSDSLRYIDQMLPAWGQGDFRTAGDVLDLAKDALASGEALVHVELNDYRDWLQSLYDGVVQLNIVRQRIAEEENLQEQPNPQMVGWFNRLIDETTHLLGEEHAASFRQWLESYQAFHAIYQDHEKRRTRKLYDFDALFSETPEIASQPAFLLFRHWYEIIEEQPEFPAPPTDEPVPQYTDDAQLAPYAAPQEAVVVAKSGRRGRRLLLLIVAIVIVGIIGLLAGTGLLPGAGGDPQIEVTWSDLSATPTEDVAGTISALQAATALVVTETLPPTATATATVLPSVTWTPLPAPTETGIPTLDPGEDFIPTVSLLLPSNTPLPSETPTATLLPTVTRTPAVTVEQDPTATNEPAESTEMPSEDDIMRGSQNILFALEHFALPEAWSEAGLSPSGLSGNWFFGQRETDRGDNVLQIDFTTDILAQMFGPDASSRLHRLEATLALNYYDPDLVENEQVYFGLGLLGADQNQAAVQALLIRPDALNIGVRVGDEFRAWTTLPINDAQIVVALERQQDGTVILYANDQQLGPARLLAAPDAAVVPYLLVQGGGVVVSVSDMIAELE